MSTIYADAWQRQQNQVKLFESMAKAAAVPIGSIATSGIQATPGIGDASQRMRRESYEWNRNWIYAAVHAISKRVASAPALAGELLGAPENEPRSAGYWRKAAKASDRFAFQSMGSRMLQKAAMDQDLEMFATHPVLDTLCRPNSVQRKFEFLYFSAANLELTGECYWVGGVSEVEGEERVEIWAVPTKWIRPIHENDLFTGYWLQSHTMTKPMRLEPENVARTYFADPADPRSVMTPLRAIMASVRTDDAIQTSQQQLMERGISPNLILTLGKTQETAGGGPARRPRLTSSQRRQIVKSVRDVWSRTVNLGDPAILDDWIESVHKLHNTPQEMDWLNSGKITKERILQAFAVHPISIGQMEGGNRAQAVEAQRITAENAVNPVIDALSETATDFLGPMYQDPPRLLVWFEKWEPKDSDLELKRWAEASKHDYVTQDEYRTRVLGLPPSDRPFKSKTLSSGPGLQFMIQMTALMINSGLDRSYVRNIFMLVYELDQKTAEALFDFVPAPLPVPVPSLPAPEPEDAIDEDAEDLPEQRHVKSFDMKPLTNLLKSTRGQKSSITRKDIQEIHAKQVSKTEEVIAKQLADHFRTSRSGNGKKGTKDPGQASS